MAKSPEPPEVACVGETMAMVTPQEPEPLEVAGNFAVNAGGAESNVAMYLAALGHRAAWVSRLGEDPLGRRVLRRVSAAGVDTSWVEMGRDAPTGVYFKDPGAGRTDVFYYRRGSAASKMTLAVVAPLLEVPAGPRLFHVTGITPALSPECDAMAEGLIRAVRARGATASFDVNYRPGLWQKHQAAGRLLSLAQQADIVFVGADEAHGLWGTKGPEDVRRLIDRPAVLVVRDGAVGATAFSPDGETFVPSLHVVIKEPVGGGDAFVAGWLSGWLRGLEAQRCLRLGHAVACVALLSTDDYQRPSSVPWFAGVLELDDDGWAEVQLGHERSGTGS